MSKPQRHSRESISILVHNKLNFSPISATFLFKGVAMRRLVLVTLAIALICCCEVTGLQPGKDLSFIYPTIKYNRIVRRDYPFLLSKRERDQEKELTKELRKPLNLIRLSDIAVDKDTVKKFMLRT